MAKVAIIGEAWGEHEAALQHPFVGPSGRELIRMLGQAGWFSGGILPLYNERIARDFWLCHPEISLHNVFNLQPRPTNDVKNLCGTKADGIPGRESLQQGAYVRQEFQSELDRLDRELKHAQPNLIIACGATPAWFLFGAGRIAKVRGAIAASVYGKTLPTYHPSAVLRDPKLRPVTVLDLMKARREADFPDIRRPRREIWTQPSLFDMETFYAKFIEPAEYLSIDIETRGDQITCIGFAPSIDRCIVVPFTDPRLPDGSYWDSQWEELQAWSFVRKCCEGPHLKVFQNGLYDLHFLWRRYGIRVLNFAEDTMLLHHSLHPESPKGLDFLGSVYTNEASWKLMTKFSGAKKDAQK